MPAPPSTLASSWTRGCGPSGSRTRREAGSLLSWTRLSDCAAADFHAVAFADGEVHADVAVAGIPHMVEVWPGAIHRGVVRDDQRARRQLGLQELGHRKVELLPTVEQHEADRAVDGLQC